MELSNRLLLLLWLIIYLNIGLQLIKHLLLKDCITDTIQLIGMTPNVCSIEFDSQVFFAKWSAIASVLLLISFSGSIMGLNNLGSDAQLNDVSASNNVDKSFSKNITGNNIDGNINGANEISPNNEDVHIFGNQLNDIANGNSNANVQVLNNDLHVQANNMNIETPGATNSQSNGTTNEISNQTDFSGVNGIVNFKNPVISI